MKRINLQPSNTQLPLIKHFIKGDVSYNQHFYLPAEPLYVEDAQGNRVLAFGNNGRGRILNELFKLQESGDLDSDLKKEVQSAIQDFTAFLADISVWYAEDSNKLLPNIHYKTFYPEHIVFYPDPKDPAFVLYRQRLDQLNELNAQHDPLPDELLDYLKEAEMKLFLGPENEKARAEAMDSIIRSHLDLPTVQWAILSMIYTPEEFQLLYDEGQRQVESAQTETPKQKIKRNKRTTSISDYRVSGHFYDQKLKNSPTDKKGQMSLFESLPSTIKVNIEKSGIERETIVEGIMLTSTENKVVHSLCKLLAIKSQNTDPSKQDYYTGNRDTELQMYGGVQEPSPRLAFTLHELTREYLGGVAPGGKETSNVKEILFRLSKKKFYINYVQTTKLPGGKQRKQQIQQFKPLLEISYYSDSITNSDGIEESSTNEIIIELHPIFRHKIDEKFIIVPSDFTKRLMIAYGSPEVSEATNKLVEYLQREKASKRSRAEYKLANLYRFLCPKWVREGRKAKVIEHTNKAIETAKLLGLLTQHEVVKAKSSDEEKVIFHIDKDWK